jgi:hypothetical protein
MNWVTIKEYESAEMAEEIAAILQQQGYRVSLEKDIQLLDITFTGMKQPDIYRVKVAQQDFKEAQAKLEELSTIDLSEMPPDHYLRSFTTDELKEVVSHKDEWSELDYAWSKQMLLEQEVITEEEIQKISKKRHEELKTQKSLSTTSLIGLYALCLAGWVVGFLIAGIPLIMGVLIRSTKRNLSDGDNIYLYDQQTRNHALALIFLATVAVIGAYFMPIILTSF